jgi:hypothetical protein
MSDHAERYIEDHGLTYCDFSAVCFMCETEQAEVWRGEGDAGQLDEYYLCRACIVTWSAYGWCRGCGMNMGDGSIVEHCEHCEE